MKPKGGVVGYAVCIGVGLVVGGAVGVVEAATLDFQLQRQSTQPASTEWVQHGRDAQRTGCQPQAVAHPWRWKWSWNGPNATGGIAAGHHTLPRNVQPITGGTCVFIADGADGVRVLNKSDGSVAGTISPGGDCNGTPAYDTASGMLLIPSSNGNLYKVNPANGTVTGTYNAGSALVGGVCLINGRAFVSAGSTVRAVDIAGMTEAWSYSAGSPVVTPPSYSASRDAVVAVTQNLNVHCIRNTDGQAKRPPVKPTPNTYAAGSTEADWGWPVIADVHGYVLVRYRLPWSTLWTWSPLPTNNATMRTNLQGNPSQQCLFAIDLDDGSVPFICNVGNGGWGGQRLSADGSGAVRTEV